MRDRKPTILAFGIKVVASHDEHPIAYVDQIDDGVEIRNPLDRAGELNIVDGEFGPGDTRSHRTASLDNGNARHFK
jgi:hypothetical protein